MLLMQKLNRKIYFFSDKVYNIVPHAGSLTLSRWLSLLFYDMGYKILYSTDKDHIARH